MTEERLKVQSDICLAEKPPSMEAFLQAMAAAGYEVKHGVSMRSSVPIIGGQIYVSLGHAAPAFMGMILIAAAIPVLYKRTPVNI
ncbi:hypothetical protein [Desulfosporosinus sp.]|uniref:hypothetical protein n=1 Tax=Desulfosporosinus sp. TaxID=157907 RepID=UPI00232832AA|nr:hypothetical protein [Desulfosporosinus sp.]MCO5384511.1 hypothetical protein [Desulfosporosinus sp.]MDA8220642.1 hypothetical protein [Desulfitobacterium hafniense]